MEMEAQETPELEAEPEAGGEAAAAAGGDDEKLMKFIKSLFVYESEEMKKLKNFY